ncbi:MAG: response regulator [Anaerolineales bacterium]
MPLSGSVLIIDDDVHLRQTFARILKQSGCEVTTAADGPEALQRLMGAVYDLVYLDIHLPGMNGLQVLKEIHRLHSQLSVVLFTGHATLQSALDAMRLGAIDYLIKPVDPDTLIARTQVILADQAVQRRRREIQAQIESLQSELKSLEKAAPPPLEEAGAGPATTFAAPADRFLKRGPLILDLQARRATFAGRVLTLPPAAFDYLVVLTRHAPDVVGYQTLVAEAQGYQTDLRQAQELAKWHIHELRDSLEPDPQRPLHVLNVRGIGYRLVVD